MLYTPSDNVSIRLEKVLLGANFLADSVFVKNFDESSQIICRLRGIILLKPSDGV